MAGAQKQVMKEREEEEEEEDDGGEEEVEEVEEKEGGQKVSLPRAVWSGSITIGLVNIPVKMIPLTRDKRVKLRMIHQKCNTPIHYKKYCDEGEEVPNDEIVHGYQLKKDRYVVFSDEELEAAKPESSDDIHLDRFVNFFAADPHYFDKTYLLVPDGSESSYSLLRRVMDRTGKAAIGKMTMHSKERVVLVHYYQNAVVATTLRYFDEVLDPVGVEELKELPQPKEEEMELAREIVDKLSGDLDLSAYRDEYRERVEEMVRTKLSGEVIKIEEKGRKPAAKSLMEALKETAESIE
ncbi:MAG TPA: Ku protein [Methanothrix sp.]|nr:Ku protein [Methanothrix sp.]HRW82118.1 Ku protein [Methanothrix sp.]